MARVLRYRYFHADITPTNLFMDLWAMTGNEWKNAKVAKWNRHLYGALYGDSFCFACKWPNDESSCIGITDTCGVCCNEFQKLGMGPQAMLLATAYDARLLLYTYDWAEQQIIFDMLHTHSWKDAYHGILPQSYKQRLSQEDVKPAGAILQHAPDSSQLPPEI